MTRAVPEIERLEAEQFGAWGKMVPSAPAAGTVWLELIVQ